MEPFKFIIQAVLLDRDENGKITGEGTSDPAVLYGSSLVEVAEQFDKLLEQGQRKEV